MVVIINCNTPGGTKCCINFNSQSYVKFPLHFLLESVPQFRGEMAFETVTFGSPTQHYSIQHCCVPFLGCCGSD